MNGRDIDAKDAVSRPRPMRKNALMSLVLGASGFVLSVGGAQCQPVWLEAEPLGGSVISTEVIWGEGELFEEYSDWVEYLRQ